MVVLARCECGKGMDLSAHGGRYWCSGCLWAETERLREERKGLPKFADDVIAYPGMEGWFPDEREPGVVGETGWTCGNEEWGVGVEECYSTRKAAKGGDS